MTRALPVLIVLALASSADAACPASDGSCDCESLPGPRVYMQTGDTQTNLLLQLGRKLRDNTPRPITIVYITSGSCANIDIMYNHIPANGMLTAATTVLNYVPSSVEDPTWVPSKVVNCTITTARFPDIGNSALFNEACAQGQVAPPATLNLTYGPRQAYVLATPRGNAETAMTYEEAYFVFGFGPTLLQAMAGTIAPWIDENELQARQQGKSTLLAWAANLGINPPTKFKGHPNAKSTDVVNALVASANPSAAIGILGAEVYDGLRDKLQIFAFRSKDQYAAYYPDSTATSRDKKNLRDGHYTVWSPTVWMDNIDGSTKVPVNADARYVIDLIAGHTVAPVPNFQPNVTVARVGLVPDCAMRVSRTFEGGPLSLYKPTTSCTCEYENAVDSTTCKTCATTTCTQGTVCRNGYCEEF